MGFTDVKKFSYPKAQLKGSTELTVKEFALTDVKYVRASEPLHGSDGQHHKTVHATIQALINIPAPTMNITSLRHFHDRIETYIRVPEPMRQYQETFGSLLVQIVLHKMPSAIKKYIDRVNETNLLLQELRKAINKEIFLKRPY